MSCCAKASPERLYRMPGNACPPSLLLIFKHVQTSRIDTAVRRHVLQRKGKRLLRYLEARNFWSKVDRDGALAETHREIALNWRPGKKLKRGNFSYDERLNSLLMKDITSRRFRNDSEPKTVSWRSSLGCFNSERSIRHHDNPVRIERAKI